MQSGAFGSSDAESASSGGDSHSGEEDSPAAAAAGDYRQFLAASIDKIKQGGEVSTSETRFVFREQLGSTNLSPKHAHQLEQNIVAGHFGGRS
jgi:hypothetical protein